MQVRAARTVGDAIARAWVPALAGGTCCGLLVWLGFHQGGYFPPEYQWAGAVAFAVLAVVCGARLGSLTPSTHALVGFGALAGLAAWTGMSSAWSPVPADALLDLQRALLYVALFGLGVVAVGHGRHARHVVWAAFAVLVAIAAAAVLSRLFAGLGDEPAGVTRLSWPLGYWNALGGVGATGLVLGTGLAAGPRAAVVLRAIAAAGATVCAWALWFSLSRGSIVAALAGLLALAALTPRRGALVVSLAIVGAAGAAGVAHPMEPPLFAAVLAAAAAVQAAVAVSGRQDALPAALRRPARAASAMAAAALALFGVAAYVVRAGDLESWTARRATDASAWIDRQWNDFLAPTTEAGPAGARRLSTARGTRSDLYRVAFDGFEAHPLRGDGAGGFEPRWYRTRVVDEQVRDAHSLGLQTLGELGAVGGLLLLTFLASVAVGVARARRRRVGLPGTTAAAVGAAVVVWVVHAAVDWDWQVPAFTGTVLVLAAAAHPAGRTRRRASARRPAAVTKATSTPERELAAA